MRKHIRIGTRGSKLALYQAYRVKDALEASYPEKTFEIVIIKTQGDKILDVPLSKIGDKGLFTKELEVAMFNREIDMAVHSLKDLPTVFPEGTKLGAVLERAAAFDALVTKDGRTLAEITSKDIIATSSLRRKAQLLRMNPDLTIVEIRGNVNTRIRKMEEGYCDAMVMAAAGLQRLEMDQHISEVIAPETMIPACAQGAIAIEILENDAFIQELISGINHRETMITTAAERTFLRAVEGGCQIPVGSHSKIDGDQFTITGFIANLDGSIFLKDTLSGPLDEANNIANQLAQKLLGEGGKSILEEIKANYTPQTGELPLKGKTIVSTRPAESNDEIARLLKARGANVLNLPMIEIETAVLDDATTEAIKNLESFSWVLFTSRNGVVHFFKQLIEVRGGTALPAGLQIGVIGDKTAAELDYYGYAPHYSASGNTSEEMAEEFIRLHSPKNEKILLPIGNLARTVLEDALSTENTVQRIEVYNTLAPQNTDETVAGLIAADRYDCILFTSPSTFQNFMKLMGGRIGSPLKLASIGATTTRVMNEAGYEALFTADPSTVEGLVKSLVGYFEKK